MAILRTQTYTQTIHGNGLFTHMKTIKVSQNVGKYISLHGCNMGWHTPTAINTYRFKPHPSIGSVLANTRGFWAQRTSIALIEASKTPNLEGWDPEKKNQDFLFKPQENYEIMVGGFNPSESYISQIGSFPQVEVGSFLACYCWWFRNLAITSWYGKYLPLFHRVSYVTCWVVQDCFHQRCERISETETGGWWCLSGMFQGGYILW